MAEDLAAQIEAWNIDLMMSKVVKRKAKCNGCGRDAYDVWDETREHCLFTVCSCGVTPRIWRK